MATSRTGTSSHKRFRREVLRRDRRAGITHCPLCGVEMDYTRGLLPNSAEPDHLTPHSLGGRDVAENGRAICRTCNQSRGNGGSKKQRKTEAAQVRHVTTLVDW